MGTIGENMPKKVVAGLAYPKLSQTPADPLYETVNDFQQYWPLAQVRAPPRFPETSRADSASSHETCPL